MIARARTDLLSNGCWQLSNLQPLWAAENIAKGRRLLPYVGAHPVAVGDAHAQP